MTLELPAPELLWARIVAEGRALLNREGNRAQAIEVHQSEEPAWVAGDRLVSEDGAGNWFVLVRGDDERALLFGGDESSELFETDFDPWADAPEWALTIDRTVTHPRLSDTDMVTFVRWWDGSAWVSTPFEEHLPEWSADDPDADDGLYMGLRSIVDPAGSPTSDS